MKIKRKLRYYCDFCKKVSGSRHIMEKHEDHCTMNPNRECGFCTIMDQPVCDISQLKKLIPPYEEFEEYDSINGEKLPYFIDKANRLPKILKELRDKTNNCPACIMAAIRQSQLPLGFFEFDFKTEMNQFFKDYKPEPTYY